MRTRFAPWPLLLVPLLAAAACGGGSSAPSGATDIALQTAHAEQGTAFAATRTAFVPRPTNTPGSGPTEVLPTPVGSAPADQPTPAGTPSPVRIISATGGPAGATASVVARTSPATLCSISYVHPSGKLSTTKGLIDQVTGANGEVRWSFHIDATTTRGVGKITVNCRGVVAQADITIS